MGQHKRAEACYREVLATDPQHADALANLANLLNARKRYREAVLAPGGSAPAAKLVENFLGRPFNNKAWTDWLNEDQGPSTTVN